jgi:hypothetical protein
MWLLLMLCAAPTSFVWWALGLLASLRLPWCSPLSTLSESNAPDVIVLLNLHMGHFQPTHQANPETFPPPGESLPPCLVLGVLQPFVLLVQQDGSTPRPNFWPQFLMGQGAMVPPGQVPPIVGAQGVFSAPTTTPLARFPSGNVRGSLPAPLLLPVPPQPLHHAQSGGPLLKQMPPVAKPERGQSENLSTKVGQGVQLESGGQILFTLN